MAEPSTIDDPHGHYIHLLVSVVHPTYEMTGAVQWENCHA
jgi:hypothetical protein